MSESKSTTTTLLKTDEMWTGDKLPNYLIGNPEIIINKVYLNFILFNILITSNFNDKVFSFSIFNIFFIFVSSMKKNSII